MRPVPAGQGMPSLTSRMPAALARGARSRPRSSSALWTAVNATPAATMASHGVRGLERDVVQAGPPARRRGRAAGARSSRPPRRRARRRPAARGGGVASRPLGSGTPVASSATSTVALPSASSVTIFRPVHRPDSRESATACRPRTTISRTVAGASTGISRLRQQRLACAREGRGLRGRVVADQRDRAAQRRGARHDAVTDRVGRAVEPRVLAVPEARDPVVVVLGQLAEQLRARDGGGGELLVEARAKDDVERIQVPACAHELLVEAAEGGTLVAADERRRVQSATGVQPALLEQQPHERVDPRHERSAGGLRVLVVERDRGVIPLGGCSNVRDREGSHRRREAAMALCRTSHRRILVSRAGFRRQTADSAHDLARVVVARTAG